MTDRFLYRLPWPDGTPITQEFGENGHRGIDGGTVVGTTLVMGARCRIVDFVNSWTTWNGQSVRSFGNAVCGDYGNGLFGLVAHLSRVDVAIGQEVDADTVVGLSGNTGVSTGPHTHFQICVNTSFPVDISQSRNPRDYLISEEDMFTEEDRRTFRELWRRTGGDAGNDFDLLKSLQNTQAAMQRLADTLASAGQGMKDDDKARVADALEAAAAELRR